jgi:predicted Zn-dependent peptidase
MYEDNPGWQLFFGLLGALYSEHSVRLDIAGTIDSIAQITPEILYKCYKTFYDLSNMVLCVSGDVDTEEILSAADTALGTSPKTTEPVIERFEDKEPEAVNKARVEKKLKVSIPMFAVGIKDTDVGYDGGRMAKKEAEISIINEIIFGKGGEFYSDLYNRGLINSHFGAAVECRKGYGFTEVGGESKDPDAVYEEIIETIKHFAKDGFSQEDFTRCKRVVYAQSVSVFDSTEAIAGNFVNSLFDGYNLLDLPRIIDSVTIDDIHRRYEMMYRQERCAISVIYPM